ncbi:MAG: class I SAM-dependent methyltransferase [Candidatus Nanoarchaeia archaeon]
MTHNKTQAVYDAFGAEYFSRNHRTILYFNMIQAFPIRIAFSQCARDSGRKLEDLDVLNIGVGNGQHCEQLCSPIYKHAMGERVRWDKMTDFDISYAMLEAAKRYYPSEAWTEKTGEKPPKQVQGDVLGLSSLLQDEQFNIALAALCDHIEDQEGMYREIWKVLRPGGRVITTYPHKQLMTTIRRDVYGIDPDYTRFTIDGKVHKVRSHILTPEDIAVYLQNTGFDIVDTVNLFHDHSFKLHSMYVSNTVRKALKALNMPLE